MKTASISTVFAAYVAVMFAVASMPGEAPKIVSQIQSRRSTEVDGMDVKLFLAGAAISARASMADRFASCSICELS